MKRNDERHDYIDLLNTNEIQNNMRKVMQMNQF